MSLLRKYKVGLVIIILLLVFSYYKLLINVSGRHGGGYAKVMSVSAKKISDDIYTRRFLIKITNEEPREISIVSVLASYNVKPSKSKYRLDLYPLKVDAKPDSNNNSILKTGDTCKYIAVFPKIRDLEKSSNVLTNSIQVEVKAAVVEDGKPSYIYVGGEPELLK